MICLMELPGISGATGPIAGSTIEATAETGEPARGDNPVHIILSGINGLLFPLLRSLLTPREVHVTQSLPSTPAAL